MAQEHQDDHDGQGGSRALEWTLAAVSGLMVAGLIGFLVLQALDSMWNAPDLKPDPIASVVDISPATNGFRVEISARNQGEATAASVRFRAKLQRDGETVETAEVTFDYLPGKAKRSGALIFMHDPRLYDVVIQPESYTDP